MPFLVERVLRRDAALRPLVRDAPRRRPFNYCNLIDVPALADRVAANDVDGESVPTWTRAIRRWVSEGAAPSPNMIRRVLGSLGFDWLVGMGRSGYRQHATVMLYALWMRGNRKRVAMQAKAIFDLSDEPRDILDDHAFLYITEAESQRIEAAALTCGWRAEGGAVSIPTRCHWPDHFPTSTDLYSAWMLLEAATTDKRRSLEQGLRFVQDGVARQVEAWLATFYPPEPRRAQKLRQSQRRKK
jgi:hypothetical protein